MSNDIHINFILTKNFIRIYVKIMNHQANPCLIINIGITNDTIDKLTKVCNILFANNKDYQLADEYDYGHLILCLIDSLFSIGVR
jgi:hypothetical protein